MDDNVDDRNRAERVLAFRWQDYAPSDPQFFQQMRDALKLLGWPRLELDNNVMNHCGTGELQLEDYLYRLEHNPNNEGLRVKGALAVRALLDAAVEREVYAHGVASRAAQVRELARLQAQQQHSEPKRQERN